MMLALALALALLMGAALALVFRQDNGLLLVAWDHWSVEMSLTMALLLGIIGFLLLHWLLNLISASLRIRALIERASARYHARLSRRALTQGLIELAEGRWTKAEALLQKRLQHSETPLINQMFSAWAALMQGASERQEGYIQAARNILPSASLALRMAQAEMLLAAGEREQARLILLELRSEEPQHAQILRLLSRAHLDAGELLPIGELLPDLKKSHALPETELARLELDLHLALLSQAAGKDELKNSYSKLPRNTQHDPRVLARYAAISHQVGDDAKAEQLVTALLEEGWDESLMSLYGQLATENPSRQLTQGEHWLALHPKNPALLLALGRIALRAKLWGKARSYLEAALGESGSAEAARELGNLMEAMGEKDQALAAYRQGMLGLPGSQPVPLPKNIGRVTNQPPLEDPRVQAPPRHGQRPAD